MASEDAKKLSPQSEARAARIRAARAFADLDQADFAKALGVSVVTVKRMERGTRETSLDDMHLLADLCDVPRQFMDDGFCFNTRPTATAEELERVRVAVIEAMNAGLAELTEALLTRDQALVTSREALDRLRRRGTRD